LLEAEKVIPVQFAGPDKETTVRKGDVSGRKSDSYKKATWDWLLKTIPREKWRDHSMEVHVLVWDRDGKPVHDQLGQTFTPDKPSIRAAINYAKKLIAEGLARMTEVTGTFRSYSAYHRGMTAGNVMTFGIWERPDE
jgi:hypothetical protein